MPAPGSAAETRRHAGRRRLSGATGEALAALVPTAILLPLLIYPLARILQVSLGGDGLATALDTLTQPPYYYLRRITFSAYEAALSTLLTLAVGLPAAYLLSVVDFPGRATLRALVTVPFVMPPIVVAMGLLALLGPGGAAQQLLHGLGLPGFPFVGTLAAILVAHAFYNVALVVRIVGATWGHLDPALGEAAATLGATPLQRGLRVTLPLLLPSILAASLLVFIFTFTSFGVIVILANDFQFYTMEAAIWSLTKAFQLEVAAVLAIVQAAFTIAVMGLYGWLQERASHRLPLTSEAATRPLPGAAARAATVAGAVTVALVLAPLAALVERSLRTGDGHGLTHYVAIFTEAPRSVGFVEPLLALRNSLTYAALTALLALVVGGAAAALIARRRGRRAALADAALMAPLGVSGVTLGLGLLLAYGHQTVRVSWGMGLIVAAHLLIAYPFATRILLTATRQVDPALREAAATLGAAPRQVLARVDLPLLAPAMAVAAVFAFAVSMGEFGAAMMLRRPETATLPVAVFDYLGRPGAANLGRALAMSGVLMLVNLAAFMAIERLRPPGSEF